MFAGAKKTIGISFVLNCGHQDCHQAIYPTFLRMFASRARTFQCINNDSPLRVT